jgi:hypothetical protein
VEENAECSAIKFDDDDGFVASLAENYANWYLSIKLVSVSFFQTK